MSSPADSLPRSRSPWWEPALWSLACLGVYLLLAHDAFYKTDGPDIARLLDDHLQKGAPLQHPWHVGFLPVLEAFRRALSWCGITPNHLQLGAWFSAVGAALGVGLAFAGLRRLVDVAVARSAALLLALNPGTLLFASVVEFHGPLLAPLALAFWWTARQIRRPSWLGMAVIGGLCHLAFLIHGQALFYPVWLLAFFLARRWSSGERRRDIWRVLLAGAVHAALWGVLPRLLPQSYGMWADLTQGLQAEGSFARPRSLDYTPHILWQEWLWPLLPVAMLVWLAPLRRTLRGEFVAFVVGMAPYLYLSVRLLVFEPEYGAYLLPMVLPGALLLAQLAGTRWRPLLLGAVLAGLLPVGLDHRAHFATQRAFDDTFASAVVTAAGAARPFVLVGSHRELAAAYARLDLPARPRPPLTDEGFLWVRENASMPRAAATPAHFAGVDAYLRALHAAGRAVLITSTALASLDDPRAAMLAENGNQEVPPNETMAGPLFAAYLRQRFDLVTAAPGVLRLVPKP